jgi:hypothetical protein
MSKKNDSQPSASNMESIISAFESLDIPSSNIPYAIRGSSAQDFSRRATAKGEFIVDPRVMPWPELEYPNLESSSLQEQSLRLLDLMRQISQLDASDDDKAYMYDSLEAKLQETQRHLAVVQMIGAKATNPDASIDALRDDAGSRSFERFGQLNEYRFVIEPRRLLTTQIQRHKNFQWPRVF